MTFETRFWSKVAVRGSDECWLWQASKVTGYGQFNLGRRGLTARAHRVAYELCVGPIPEGLMVLHSCDVRACCNPSHLRVGTNADNMRDMADRGRSRAAGRGRVLTMHDARDIRAQAGKTPRRGVISQLARFFGADRKTVELIVRGITYREASSSAALATRTAMEGDLPSNSEPAHQPGKRAQAS